MTGPPKTKHPPGSDSQRVRISFNDLHNHPSKAIDCTDCTLSLRWLQAAGAHACHLTTA